MVDINPKKCITCKIKQPISNYPNEEKQCIVLHANEKIWSMLQLKHVSHAS